MHYKLGAKLVLQIGAAIFYYKLGQTLLQIGAASLLQIGASVVTNWGKMFYKLGQVLQIRAIITNWGLAIDYTQYCDKDYSIPVNLATPNPLYLSSLYYSR